MIRVLVVDDSAVQREFLAHILSSNPDIQVIGTAKDGVDALRAVEREKPDVITMDINMPRMDGFEAARRIMETYPTPIVIVCGSWDIQEVATTFHALEAGALVVLPRPAGFGSPDHQATAGELIQTVKLVSEVKVVRRWAHLRRSSTSQITPAVEDVGYRLEAARVQLIAIGASTGGPVVLRTILASLPADFPIPIMVVQHMAAGFISGFVEWLAQTTSLEVQIAADREALLPGHIYVAPDGYHMKALIGGRVALTLDEPENGLRPSVSYLFRSIAKLYGPRAIGVLLTGMGKDGAKELKLMKDRGAVTIVQDEPSSVVYGMPGEAVRLGAATYTFPPRQIAAVLAGLVNHP